MSLLISSLSRLILSDGSISDKNLCNILQADFKNEAFDDVFQRLRATLSKISVKISRIYFEPESQFYYIALNSNQSDNFLPARIRQLTKKQLDTLMFCFLSFYNAKRYILKNELVDFLILNSDFSVHMFDKILQKFVIEQYISINSKNEYFYGIRTMLDFKGRFLNGFLVNDINIKYFECQICSSIILFEKNSISCPDSSCSQKFHNSCLETIEFNTCHFSNKAFKIE